MATEVLTHLIKYRVDGSELSKLKAVENLVNATGGSFKKYAGAATSADKASVGFAGSLAKLTQRAVLTIPVWLALRSAFMGFLSTVREGLDYIREFDKAMARAAAVTTDIKDMGKFMQSLRNVAATLSAETGKSVKDVVEAYYRFATAGINGTKAVHGMNIALKTSVALMGDSTETSRVMADMYNLLGDRIEGATTVQEKMNIIGSTIATLYRDNAFELNEFAAGMKNFAAIANNFNLTFDQTMALMATSHTLMQRGGTAGTQLSRSFLMLVKNIDKANAVLGRNVDFNQEAAFDVLIEVLVKLNSLYGENVKKAEELMGIFGIKGGKVIQTFASNLDEVAKNLGLLASKDPEERMRTLLEMFKLQTDTIDVQINRMNILKKQTVEAFVIGVTGATNYVDALKKVNNFIENNLLPTVLTLSVTLRRIATNIREASESKWNLFPGAGNAIALAQATFDNRKLEEALKRRIQKSVIEGLKGGGEIGYYDLKKQVEEKFQEFNSLSGYDQFNFLTDLGFDEEQAYKYLDALEEVEVRLLNMKKTNLEGEGADENKKKLVDEIKGLLGEELSLEEDITRTLEAQLSLLEIGSIYGKNDIEIEKEKLAMMEKEGKNLTDLNKQRLKILDTMKEEVIELGSIMKDSFEEGLEGLLTGEANFSDFMNNLATTFRETIASETASSFTDLVAQSGMFAEFGSFFSNFRHMFDDSVSGSIKQAGDYHGDKVKQSIAEGADYHAAVISGNAPGIGSVTGRFGGYAGLAGATLPGFGAGGWFNQPIGGLEQQIDNIESYIQGESSSLGTATRGQVLGAGVTAALTGYSMYQGAGGAQGGGMAMGAGIMGGLGAGMMGLSSLGFLAGSSGLAGTIGGLLGPVGLGLVVGAMIMSAVAAKDKEGEEVSIESRTEARSIAPRIDVTNKKLEIINRNLVALKQELTYILPQSAYFSEATNIEDNFAMNSMRGLS